MSPTEAWTALGHSLVFLFICRRGTSWKLLHGPAPKFRTRTEGSKATAREKASSLPAKSQQQRPPHRHAQRGCPWLWHRSPPAAPRPKGVREWSWEASSIPV